MLLHFKNLNSKLLKVNRFFRLANFYYIFQKKKIESYLESIQLEIDNCIESILLEMPRGTNNQKFIIDNYLKPLIKKHRCEIPEHIQTAKSPNSFPLIVKHRLNWIAARKNIMLDQIDKRFKDFMLTYILAVPKEIDNPITPLEKDFNENIRILELAIKMNECLFIKDKTVFTNELLNQKGPVFFISLMYELGFLEKWILHYDPKNIGDFFGKEFLHYFPNASLETLRTYCSKLRHLYNRENTSKNYLQILEIKKLLKNDD